MIIATLLSGLATLLWLSLFAYLGYVITQRGRRRPMQISASLVVIIIVAALVASTLGAGLVVIEAGEVGVVFSAITGTRDTPLYPGINFIIPYVETVYRYSTLEQVYTMSKTAGEGEIVGDDSLWSPTVEGLQVGIDSSTRYKIDPAKAAHIHNNLRDYKNILVRPTIRSRVRLHVSRHTVTDVYGSLRAQIQADIEADIRERFEREGLLLLSFDIRNVNFSTEYAQAIEQKQIAQQQAEQMRYVLDKERQEAERKKIEAEGFKQAAITRAEGDAEALRLVSQALAQNPDLLTYKYIEKLAPNVQVLMLPSGSPFIFDLKQLTQQATTPGQ